MDRTSRRTVILSTSASCSASPFASWRRSREKVGRAPSRAEAYARTARSQASVALSSRRSWSRTNSSGVKYCIVSDGLLGRCFVEGVSGGRLSPLLKMRQGLGPRRRQVRGMPHPGAYRRLDIRGEQAVVQFIRPANYDV